MIQLSDNSIAIICGNLNARTNINPDYEWRNVDGKDGELMNLLPTDILYGESNTHFLKENKLLQRHSMDKCKPNEYGGRLLDLFKSANLITLNGRVGSHKGVGEYTRMYFNGVWYQLSQCIFLSKKLLSFGIHFHCTDKSDLNFHSIQSPNWVTPRLSLHTVLTWTPSGDVITGISTVIIVKLHPIYSPVWQSLPVHPSIQFWPGHSPLTSSQATRQLHVVPQATPKYSSGQSG